MAINLPARIALAFVLSLVAGGMVQQAAMLNDRANGPLQALGRLPSASCWSRVFGAVAWWRPSAIGRTAVAVLAVMLMSGVAVYIFGASTSAPGGRRQHRVHDAGADRLLFYAAIGSRGGDPLEAAAQRPSHAQMTRWLDLAPACAL
jgi:hypothetical protein